MYLKVQIITKHDEKQTNKKAQLGVEVAQS